MKKALLWIAACLTLGCAGAVGTPGLPAPVGVLRPEDRVLFGDFSRVTAIAATLDRVYIAYPNAIGIWRPIERRWELPRAPSNPDKLIGVISAAADPFDRSLWLATSTGWLHYNEDIDRWTEGSFTSPSPAGNPPASLRTPHGIAEAERDMPALRVYAAQILTGPHLESGTFTAAAPAADGRGWYIGTSHRGAVYVDRVANVPQPLTLGLGGTEVGALTLGEDGVWVVTNRSVNRLAAATEVSADMSRSSTLFGTPAVGFPFETAHQVVRDGDALFLATNQGAVRIDTRNGLADVWGPARGLVGGNALSIVRVADRIAVGTTRGLFEIGSDDKVMRRDQLFQRPILALASKGDTLWVGSDIGLFAILPGDEKLQQPDALRGVLPPSTPILGIGYFQDTLVAMTPQQLVWRSPVTGSWTLGPPLSNQLGELRFFFVDNSGIWIGGDFGVSATRPNRTFSWILSTTRDIPGRITGVVHEGNSLWVGSTEGLVRFRLGGR